MELISKDLFFLKVYHLECHLEGTKVIKDSELLDCMIIYIKFKNDRELNLTNLNIYHKKLCQEQDINTQIIKHDNEEHYKKALKKTNKLKESINEKIEEMEKLLKQNVLSRDTISKIHYESTNLVYLQNKLESLSYIKEIKPYIRIYCHKESREYNYFNVSIKPLLK